MLGRRRTLWTGLSRVGVIATVIGTIVGGTGYAPAQAAKPTPPPPVKGVPGVSGVVSLKSHFKTPPDAAATSFQPSLTRFPAAAAGRVALGAKAHAAGTPVWAQSVPGVRVAPSAVNVRVLDRTAAAKAGVPGVLVAVSGDAAGQARIGVDYRAWSQSYGGNYGLRLRLFQYPACILSTPQLAQCRARTPLNSTNDFAEASVSAVVNLPASRSAATTGERDLAALASTEVVLAAEGDSGADGGAGGTYEATDLKPSGTWSAGSSTGSFTYTYPLSLAQAASSLLPKLSLSYDSASIDGQTASTQAQASWIGDGWSLPRSYIEQTFTTCNDKPEGTDAPVSTYDRCYSGPLLTMSLNGSSNALVWDAGKSTWKSQADDGSVVTHVTNGGDNGSGTYNHDYWTVTTREGTVYSFGLNHLPGWSSGKGATNSVDSTPVYSAHSPNGTTFTDPCYNATWSQSVCTMAYRWNLDYVKDVNGNAMAYYYKQDTNYYGKNKGATMTSYIRDSHLDRIDYGFADGNAYGTVPDRLQFTTGDRCLTGTCQPLNSTTKANWPDVPFDLVCASGATCTSWSPSFFSTVRLTGIAAKQWSTASSSYIDVDSYALTQTIPPTGDGTSPTLWLSSITHTGADLNGGGSSSPITLPPVTFSAVQLQNRVDTTTDGLPAFYKYRVQSVTTESGSVITATYGQPDPCTAPVTQSPATNTKSCYPVKWAPPGYTDPITDWFNKYVVTKVTETDPTGGAPAKATSYSYLGGAAWRYDENEVVKAKDRTYGQFRGYATVQTRVGDGVNDPQTLTETTYYRGMSKNNSTTVVNLTDSQGATHEDIDELAGRKLEETAYLGDGGPADHSTITSYWVSGASATRTRTGLSDLTARAVQQVESFSRQAVTSTGTTTWTYTETDDSYDTSVTSPTFGLVQYSYNHTVPVDPAYDKCTATKYAPANLAKNLTGLASEREVLAVACGGYVAGAKASAPGSVNTLTAPASVSRPAQVISDNITFYDDTTWNTTFPQTAAPTKGMVTMARQAQDYSGGAYVYKTTARSKYDGYGRKTEAYDGNGNLTTNGYTMNTVGLTVGQSVTNALGQTTSSTLETGRGSTLTATDINNIVTTQRYDALGRLVSVWTNSRATSLPANFKYAYVISNTGISSATTQKLNDSSGYTTSTLIYDAMLRTRQTQAMTPQGGRTVNDTFYDSRGYPRMKYNSWWDPATAPNTTLVSPSGLNPAAQVYDQEAFTYDGLGRTVITTNLKNNVEVSHATTVYNGDRVTTIPPAGGIATAKVTDVVGRTVELDQFSTAPVLTTPANTFTGIFTVSGGTKQAVAYTFDSHGNQNTITQGSGGPTWTSTYNLLGQVTAKTDADAGTTTNIKYDTNGNTIQQTDARGKTISFAYDALDRKIGQYRGTVEQQSAATQVAKWVYDNSNNAVPGMSYAKGKLTTSINYSDSGDAYVKQQNNYNIFGVSTGVTITIPAVEGALAGTYTYSQIYTSTTGLPLKDIYAARPGLPAETVLHGYTGALDLPNTLGGLTGYSQGTTYDAYGRVEQQKLGAGTNLAYVTNTYDPHTGDLVDRLVTRSTGTPASVDEQAYKYDDAGNLLKQVSTRWGSASSSETQCFAYNDLQQLTGAWTANDACAAAPTAQSHGMVADALGTSSAYWTTWQIDALGDRTQEVKHAFTGGPASDITTSYTYNSSGANQPHTLTGTSTTGGASGSASYTYDAAGNMATRNAGNGSQVFAYNDANKLIGITGSTGGDSSFFYDADGGTILQRDPGTVTLYLGSEQLVLNTATQTITGQRYYTLPGGGTVVRTGTATNAYQFALQDKHETPTLYLDSTAQTPTWRQYTPYGAPRGPVVAAPDNHGFLNKPMDTNTGLTIVGAREYDPDTGRFITADPVFDAQKPGELNGYAYAANNPVLNADPSGERIPDDEDGGSSYTPVSTGGGSWFGGLFGRFSFVRQAVQATIDQAYKGKLGKTHVGYFDRHGKGPWWKWPSLRELDINTDQSGKGMCCEPNSAGGAYPKPDPNKLWTRAVSWERNFDRANSVDGLWKYNPETEQIKELTFKPVCARNCQINTVPEQFVPGTTAEKGGSWGIDKTSRWTRTGTSYLENWGRDVKPGQWLSKANGVLEGAAPALKAVGIVGTVVTVGVDIYDVVKAPPGQKVATAVHAAGELVGGIGGAAIGGAIGGPVGAMIGGYVGSKVGGWLAGKACGWFHC